MRIRSRLLILILAVLIPAMLTALAATYYVYHEAQKENRDNLREITHVLALMVDRKIATWEAVLDTLATSEALDQGDMAAFHEQARRAAAGRDKIILLVDPQGQVLLNSGSAPEPDLPIMQALRARAGSRDRLISDLFYGPTARQYSVTLQIPVVREGRVMYYLSMEVAARALQKTLQEQDLPASWIATVVDRNGLVVARNKEPEKYVGQRVSGNMPQKITSQIEGLNHGTALSGEEVSSFFSRAPRSGWTFIVSVTRKELQQTVWNTAALMGSGLLGLMLLAIIAAFALGRSTTRKIEALRQTAAQLGRGPSLPLQASGVLEIDAVRDAMLQADAQIRQSAAEMEQRIAEAVALAQRTQQALVHAQKLEALGRLTGGIAHDFNNVLQTLTTGLQVAAHSARDARALTALEICTRAVDQAADLVRQLMVFGTVQQARREIMDVAQRIQTITPMLESGLGPDIRLWKEVEEGVWPVAVDPLQFELALLNLSINARDAMPQGGTLRLHACNCPLSRPLIHPLGQLPAGDYVRLSVSDNGVGMSEETMLQAVDPFFTTKRMGEGTGLGLPQVYGFARQSGGLLILESTLGVGTSALFYLPRFQAEESASDQPLAPVASQALALPMKADIAVSASAAQATVLLVEDDPLVRSVVAPALEAAGYAVRQADNGDEAVACLQSGAAIDLVFSDIVMPGTVSGLDLAALLRQSYPAIGVVLASGYSERQAQLPDVRILAKPYRAADMLQALEAEWLAKKELRAAHRPG